MKIRGHSGCEIKIQDGFIVKSTSDKTYFSRLLKQIEKQKSFCTDDTLQAIKTPEIYEVIEATDSLSFKMELKLCQSHIEFFQSSNKEDIDFLFRCLCRLIYINITKSQLEEVDSRVFLKKYTDTRNAILANSILDRYDFLDQFLKIENIFAKFPKVLKLPTGFCHGDLTFSNILIDGRKKEIILIDFLDSFIESPIQDMVKIRQDTFFKWSYHFYDESFDKKKIDIVMEHLDKNFHSFFNQFEFYRDYYFFFQILNILRVLRYAKEEKIILSIKGYLNKILEL